MATAVLEARQNLVGKLDGRALGADLLAAVAELQSAASVKPAGSTSEGPVE